MCLCGVFYYVITVSGCTRMMSFGEVVSSDKKNNVGALARGRPQLSSCQTSHLFLQRFLPSGGHLWRRRALAGASLQQVNPGRPRALLVLEVEQDILVQGEELLVPTAVLRRLLAQVSALSPLFTRDQRQKQRVPFVVADALLHFLFFFFFISRTVLEERRREWNSRSFHREPMVFGVACKLSHRETRGSAAPWRTEKLPR